MSGGLGSISLPQKAFLVGIQLVKSVVIKTVTNLYLITDSTLYKEDREKDYCHYLSGGSLCGLENCYDL